MPQEFQEPLILKQHRTPASKSFEETLVSHYREWFVCFVSKHQPLRRRQIKMSRLPCPLVTTVQGTLSLHKSSENACLCNCWLKTNPKQQPQKTHGTCCDTGALYTSASNTHTPFQTASWSLSYSTSDPATYECIFGVISWRLEYLGPCCPCRKHRRSSSFLASVQPSCLAVAIIWGVNEWTKDSLSNFSSLLLMQLEEI